MSKRDINLHLNSIFTVLRRYIILLIIMKHLFTIFCFLFISNSFSQITEIDTNLINLSNGFSSNPKNFVNHNGNIFFSGIFWGLQDYNLYLYNGNDIKRIRTSEDSGIIRHSGRFSFAENTIYFLGTKPFSNNSNDIYLYAYNYPDDYARNILPIEYDFNFNFTFSLEDKTFFNNFNQLWVSDGTINGTQIIKEIKVHDEEKPVRLGNKMLFVGEDDIYGKELWITDGTTSGTYLVKDIYSGSSDSKISGLFEFNGKIYFSATDGINGFELWTSNGTEVGTHLVKNIDQSSSNSLNDHYKFIVFGDYFYFFAKQSGQVQLWKSDGTETGTVLFKNVNQTPNFGVGKSIDGAAKSSFFAFTAYNRNPATNKYTEVLWRSDGTQEGTFPVKTFNTESDFGFNTGIFEKVNDQIFVKSPTLISTELFYTDGTINGTKLLSDEYNVYTNLQVNNNQVLMTAGTLGSIKKFLNINFLTGDSIEILEEIADSEVDFKLYNEEILFSNKYEYPYSSPPEGKELWHSDLNGNNATLLADINISFGSTPRSFHKLYDKTLFGAKNIDNRDGYFLTDGTKEGTTLLKTFQHISPSIDKEFYLMNGEYYFNASPLDDPLNKYYLHKTDGTSEGTMLVTDQITINYEKYASSNNNILFINRPNSFVELWASNGTDQGTFKLHEFNGSNVAYSLFTSMTTFNNSGYVTISTKTPSDQFIINYLWKINENLELQLIYQQNLSTQNFNNSQIFLLGIVDNKLIFAIDENDNGDRVRIFAINENDEIEFLFSTNGRLVYDPLGTKFIKTQNNLLIPINIAENKNSFIKTNGTSEGSMVFPTINGFKILNMKPCGDYIYFTDVGFQYGGKLMRTNIHNGNTTLIKFFEYNGGALFSSMECHKNTFLYSHNEKFTDPFWESRGFLNVVYDNGEQNQILINTIDNEAILTISNLFSDGEILYFALSNITRGGELYNSNFQVQLNTKEIDIILNSQESNLTIYPNPASKEVNILSIDQSKIQQIQIFDFTGKLMEIVFHNSNEIKLNTDKFKSGIYLLKVKTDKNTETKKLIIR